MTNKLDGMTFCITGKTRVKRDELKEIIVENGGSVVASVNNKCSHLIIANPYSTTVKANSARDMGVKLISEDYFFNMVE